VNVARAAALVEQLAAHGVEECCVCPGGRNSPLVLVLERVTGLSVRFFFEERAAAFFALGRAKATHRPVAVVTTSGTAAAELLPAAVEAHYAAVPLVLITADRPRAYRGTGAPQTIEQAGLFGRYAPTGFDGEGPDDRPDLSGWHADHPIHLNICFDEPLVDGPVPVLRLRPAPLAEPATPAADDLAPLRAFLAETTRPLVLVGPLDARDHDGVRTFLGRYGAPVYAEAASGLREDRALDALLLRSGEGVLRRAEFDGVLRIGGVPTVRLWRDLETRRDVRVCAVARAPFPGLTHAALVVGPPGDVLRAASVAAARRADSLLHRDRARAELVAALCATEPRAEQSLIRTLSARVPDGALVYLGNSLPIRVWDLAARREARGWQVAVNRGANGIDGQLSTFLGMCAPGREHWAVVGDLTALYDLAAPWVLPQLVSGPIRIVVVNNGGGQIFARLSPHAVLRNEHDHDFSAWAGMWRLAHHRWTAVPAAAPADARCVIELVPDNAATARWWRAYDALDDGT